MSLVIESYNGEYYRGKVGDHNVVAKPVVGRPVVDLDKFNFDHKSFLTYWGIYKDGNNIPYHVYQSYLYTLEEFESRCDALGYNLFDDKKGGHPSKVLVKIFEDILGGLNFLKYRQHWRGDLSLTNIVIVKHNDQSNPDISAMMIGVHDNFTMFGSIRAPLPSSSLVEDDFSSLKSLLEHFFYDPTTKEFYNEEAKDLIQRFGPDSSLKPILEGNWLLLLRHPLFYEDEKAMEYFRRYGDFLNGAFLQIQNTKFVTSLESLNYTNWNADFEDKLKDKCEDSREKGPSKGRVVPAEEYYNSTIHLVKYYRNLISHYLDIKETKDMFEKRTFPHIRRTMRVYHPDLLIQIYKVFEEERKTVEPIGDQFYLGGYLFPAFD